MSCPASSLDNIHSSWFRYIQINRQRFKTRCWYIMKPYSATAEPISLFQCIQKLILLDGLEDFVSSTSAWNFFLVSRRLMWCFHPVRCSKGSLLMFECRKELPLIYYTACLNCLSQDSSSITTLAHNRKRTHCQLAQIRPWTSIWYNFCYRSVWNPWPK